MGVCSGLFIFKGGEIQIFRDGLRQPADGEDILVIGGMCQKRLEAGECDAILQRSRHLSLCAGYHARAFTLNLMYFRIMSANGVVSRRSDAVAAHNSNKEKEQFLFALSTAYKNTLGAATTNPIMRNSPAFYKLLLCTADTVLSFKDHYGFFSLHFEKIAVKRRSLY